VYGKSVCTVVRPVKAGVFSKSHLTHRGNSQEPRSLNSREGGKPPFLKPIDKAIFKDGERAIGP